MIQGIETRFLQALRIRSLPNNDNVVEVYSDDEIESNCEDGGAIQSYTFEVTI